MIGGLRDFEARVMIRKKVWKKRKVVSASVASINQSIERFVPPPPRMCVTLTPALSVTRVSPSVKNLAKTFGSTAASHAHE